MVTSRPDVAGGGAVARGWTARLTGRGRPVDGKTSEGEFILLVHAVLSFG